MKRRPASEPRPGTTWHGYAIERAIARCRDGIKISSTYRGRAADGSAVVLKLLDTGPRPAPHEAVWARESFAWERQVLAACAHPGGPRLVESFFDAWRPVLVMSDLPGESLYVVRGPVVFRAASIARQVAEIVAHVHARGYSHGDLKPEHMLVDEAGTTALIDFGSARRLTPERARQDVVMIGLLAFSLATLLPFETSRRDFSALADHSLCPVVEAALGGGLDAAGMARELAVVERGGR